MNDLPKKPVTPKELPSVSETTNNSCNRPFEGIALGPHVKRNYANTLPLRSSQANRGAAPAQEIYLPGDIIGAQFEIVAKLGEGGMGVVYLVYHREHDCFYALKTFRNKFLTNARRRAAFKKEALVWVNLEKHPFILSAEWVAELENRLFVVMQAIPPDDQDCVDLQDHIIYNKGPLDVEQIMRWSIQFCYAMEHANAHGLKAHLDIKPRNLIITPDRMLKIADFGLAAAAREAFLGEDGPLVAGSTAQAYGMTVLQTQNNHRICGTPGYIAPEVYEGKAGDICSDIYAFGIVLWQMVTGSGVPAFHVDLPVPDGQDDEGYIHRYCEAVYQRQVKESPPRSNVSASLNEIIRHCLCPVPLDRPKDFARLRKELESLYQDRGGRAVEVPAVERTTEFWLNKGTSLHALSRPEEAIVCYDKALEIDPQDAKGWNGKGISLYALGRIEEAIDCCHKALAVNSRSALTWNNKGILLDAAGRPEEAESCFDKALEIDPRHAPAWNNKGNSLDTSGRREEAIDCFDKALEIDPRYVTAWCNKGNELVALGRHDEAIVCYDKALEIDPGYDAAWYNKSTTLKDLGRHEEALGCDNQVLEIDPRHVAAWYNKGVSLNTLGRYEEAIICYDKVLDIDPRNALAWANKGFSLAAWGNPEEAIACYDKALEIDPLDALTWSNKGNCLNVLDAREEAIDCHDRALEIDPRYTDAWNNKGVSLNDLNRPEEAIVCYDKALKIEPRNARTWYNKGNSLRALDANKEAIVCYDKALEIDPRDIGAWNDKGNSLFALDRPEEAMGCWEQALAVDPEYWQAWFNKGCCLNSLGAHEEAIDCYDKAVQIDEWDMRAWFNKAVAEENCGRRKNAAQSYRRFLELVPPQHTAHIDHARRRIEELA